MIFLDRTAELAALDELTGSGGLAVVWGRRRIGKTRLLVEWCERRHGVYTVADQSDPHVQRAYFAMAIATALPGFADVEYPSWERLFARLASDAVGRKFRGPIVIDELPYLVAASPDLPSVLQRWLDHDAKRAQLSVALAGSSQRMMQGFVLAHDNPLYGRARAVVDLRPLPPSCLAKAFGRLAPTSLIEHWAAWGGVPRYWELASARRGSVRERVVALALDPLGPLFAEPERLLLEETPPATDVRPVLDAIGAGAHRLSEVASRLARPATALSRPLERLTTMGFIRRETPHGEPLRGGKRSLYKIDDPFLRLWFRVVAPNKAALIAGTPASRSAVLAAHWDALVAEAWEDLCRQQLPTMQRTAIARIGPWQPPRRYWHADEPEWDLVSESLDRSHVLVGEAWFSHRAVTAAAIRRDAARLEARRLPPNVDPRRSIRALFVPRVAAGGRRAGGAVHVVTLADLLR